MADPRAFISFDFDHDEKQRMLFVGQVRNTRTPFVIQDWSSKVALRQDQWEALINTKINRCHMLIVLVGRTMASARGVAKEIAMAKSQNVPIFGIYVDGANTSSNLPKGLPRSRVIKWEWTKIAAAVHQVMGEGKNR